MRKQLPRYYKCTQNRKLLKVCSFLKGKKIDMYTLRECTTMNYTNLLMVGVYLAKRVKNWKELQIHIYKK